MSMPIEELSYWAQEALKYHNEVNKMPDGD